MTDLLDKRRAHGLPRWIRRISAPAATLVSLYGVLWTFNHDGSIPFGAHVPRRIIVWATQHPDLRNLPAYFAVSTLWLVAIARPAIRMRVGAVLLVVGATAEVIQVFLPGRTPSLSDVGWSWLGTAAAWLIVHAVSEAYGRQPVLRPAS